MAPHIFFEFVKFSHTLFALPFALGAFWAYKIGNVDYVLLGKIIGEMFFARTSGMAMNRILDRHFDSKNPRTMGRPLPSGRITIQMAWFINISSAVCFAVLASTINTFCFWGSFPALLVLWGYSSLKRFTRFCHLGIGFALALAPVGTAWALGRYSEWSVYLLAAGVGFWVTGFDLIYSLLDVESDRKEGLHSLPADTGIPATLRAAFYLHIAALAIISIWGFSLKLRSSFFVLLLIFGMAMLKQHSVGKKADPVRINSNFFTLNAAFGLGFLAATIIAIG
ncbi:4-hydroxybenzoate octaprenyltransferase [bacterium]|nr:4-hydroxybenzoate octaprenyltransferase [bacterium]